MRARAIESQCWVLAPAQHGRHDDEGLRESHGHSMIVDPWGHVVARAADGPGIALAEIVRIVSEIEQTEASSEDAGSPLGRAVLEPIWSELEAAAMVQLEKISIEDLCRKARDAGVESGRENQVDFAI